MVECNNVVVPTSNEWWVDSGVTHHIAKTKEGLESFRELKPGEQHI
jgi:hypothetical protein